MEGCEELQVLLSGPITVQALLPHLPDLLSLLETLRHDASFQVVNSSLQVIDALIGVLGTTLSSHLPGLLWSIVRHVGDPRVVVRIQGMKVYQTLLHAASPQTVTPLLCDHLSHRNSRVREDCINLLTVALSTFPSSDFNLMAIGERVSLCLVDGKRRVRQASLEAMAALAQFLGPVKLPVLMSHVEKLEVSLFFNN